MKTSTERMIASKEGPIGWMQFNNPARHNAVSVDMWKSVSEIMDETSLPQTLVSFHLRPLRENGILATERKGPFIYYSISEPGLIDLLISLAGVSPKGKSAEEVNFIFPPMRFMQKWMK